ncbi:phage tail protein [Riemerella anatipestifer]|uniref:phage tail protein n=2 Tax=Riemerella anatipestifer TaxID=34085 RepID=UPI002097AF4E|nr:phage tail protein [Riemerella anatipestifer]MCO7318612.1 phage tail protein [Riemerella anatipestifer]MCQ4154924.1 phage tail protein [Riemerella anatipestifer]MCQ4180918.1 phage tail protein [Riemerella anatipestifer]MCW0474093.1 phage tail protein [Riemerella anatipestifer]MDY3397009.1 phage tail protein [Riemerella anatipestifer]
MFIIKRNNSTVAPIKAKGTVVEKLFGEETVTMDFSLPHFVLFRIGDTVEVYGKTYYISQEPVVNKKSSREYVYNLVFNGEKYRLAEVQYFFYDENNELNISEFSITATAQKMVELLVANANRTQTGWSVGRIDSTETKTVDFSEYNCLAALTKISEEFGLEFWIDADKSIHLEERKKVSGYTLEYGKSKGLKGITRNPYTESSLVTRLYARGSSRNIPKNYRNGQKVLRMPVPFLEKNTDKYGIVEHTQPFEDIYPKRVGTVTQVYADNPLKFSDSTLDFDLNEYNEYGNTIIQKGISAKVIFQTGDLAGYTLEVKEYGFDSVSKTFTLLKNQDEKSFDIPSDTFRPQVGDKYIIIDIAMPKSYVENAEQELQAAAQDYLDKNSKQRFIYAVEPDPIYLKKINFNLKLGHTIRFKDSDFGLDDDIRVISITRNINNPYDISFEIAEQATITQIVRNYIEKEKAQTAIKKQQKYNAEMARRSFLFAEEIKNNVFDNEGYFDAQKIKPLSIETGMLSVGSRMQQFSLPNIALSITSDNKRLHNTAGQMVHLTIDPNAPRTWNLAENTTVQFSDNFNFIYIKADKIGSNATIVVTEQKILFDSDPIFYFFLAGNVSSIINGVRRIKTSYGYTQITPSEITTGRITSPNGSNYIDLKQDGIEINAKVTFASNSPAIKQVVDAVSVGGVNLARNTEFKNGGEHWSKGYPQAEFLPNERSVKITSIDGQVYNQIDQNIKCEKNTEYTISAFVKGIGSAFFYALEMKENGTHTTVYSDNYREFPVNSEYKYVNFTISTQSDTAYFIFILRAFSNNTVWFKDVKVEKGNKATDWSPNPKDIEAEIITIAEAKSNLARIQAEAHADNIVTAEEQARINEAKAKLEEAKAHAQALVTTHRNEVISKFDSLGTMAWENYIEKAMLGNTIVQGGYIKTELLNASAIVSNGGGATTSQLNNAINGVIVGGRNLARNTEFKNGGEHWSKGYPQAEFLPNERAVKITSIDGQDYNQIDQNIKCEKNTEYTISAFVKGIGSAFFYALEMKENGTYTAVYSDNYRVFPINSEYKYVKFTIRTQSDTAYFIFILRAFSNNTVWFKDVKVEKGNKATDWSPNPQDIETLFANLQQGISNMQTSLSDVKTKTDNFASIQGGLMMANLMSVGSNQANQNAFISGITDEGAMSVRFGAGSNYANKHNAPFRVLDNGKMIAKDADITGRITATGGNIGDWEINGSSFRSSSIGSNDSWAQYSSYAFFSPETFLIRKNGSERGETKEVMMGITSSISTGSEGAAAAIKSNIKKTQYDFDRDNVALRLEAKNGVTNTALDILNGDIRVGGEVGYTGELFLGGVWLTIRKGIITNYS